MFSRRNRNIALLGLVGVAFVMSLCLIFGIIAGKYPSTTSIEGGQVFHPTLQFVHKPDGSIESLPYTKSNRHAIYITSSTDVVVESQGNAWISANWQDLQLLNTTQVVLPPGRNTVVWIFLGYPAGRVRVYPKP